MEVEIAKIKIGANRRSLDMEVVKDLAVSIDEIGLMHPIVVDAEFNLIAGLHRLKAVQVLGLEVIECTVLDINGLLAELAEIDENFVRTPLSEREKCKSMFRRKQIYEKLHPETRHGGDRKSEKIKSASCGLDFEQVKSFAQDTAEKLGISASTVERQARIGERVTPEAMAVFDNAEEKFSQREGLKLTHVAPEHQEEAARQYVAGEIRTISDYKPPETPQNVQNHQDRDGNQPKTAIRPEKPKGAKKKTAKGKATANQAVPEKPDADSPPTLSAPKPPPVSQATKGASGQTAGSHAADGQEAESQAARTPPVKNEPEQEKVPCAPKHDAPPIPTMPVPAPPDQSVDAAAKEKAKKALAASYKDPIIGRIVADMKDADMERPLTTEIFVGDFESAINALIKRIKWFDIQEYQDIFAEVTEEQFQQLREIEKRAYSCLDNFMNTVKEKMNA